MNIIERFQFVTTCRNCLKAQAYQLDTPSRLSVECRATPDGKEISKLWRCDAGLWLAKGSYRNTYYPISLEIWAKHVTIECANTDLTIIPREEWPSTTKDEVSDATD